MFSSEFESLKEELDGALQEDDEDAHFLGLDPELRNRLERTGGVACTHMDDHGHESHLGLRSGLNVWVPPTCMC